MRLSFVLCLLLPLAGCDLCWVRGEGMTTCPGDDDAADDDAADDDAADDDAADDDTGDDDTGDDDSGDDDTGDDDTADDDDTGDDDTGDDDTAADDDVADDDTGDDDTGDDDTVADPCDGAPTVLNLGTASLPVVCVQPGSFFMGSPGNEPGRGSDEDQHRVHITHAYLILATEVTQSAFLEVSGFSPSDCLYGCGAQRPVQDVTWPQALEFANALSARTGQPAACVVNDDASTCDYDGAGWRLPTEAEWEYAARAGEAHVYSGSDTLSDVGWCSGPAQPYEARDVAGLQANAWGLYDMSGNVAEWVWDRHEAYPASEVWDPTGPTTGSFRTHRGGAFPLTDAQCRVADRSSTIGSTSNWNRGFRVVRTLP